MLRFYPHPKSVEAQKGSGKDDCHYCPFKGTISTSMSGAVGGAGQLFRNGFVALQPQRRSIDYVRYWVG